MPDLLEIERNDLGELDRLASAYQAIDSSALPQEFKDRFAKLAEETISLTLDAAAKVRPRWEQMKQVGWQGHAAQVHTLRGNFLRGVEARLAYLAKARRIANLAALLTDREIPGSEKLALAHQALATLIGSVFSKWQTLDDLEEILVETHPFSAEQFDALTARYRPSHAWCMQEDVPVTGYFSAVALGLFAPED